MQTTKGNITFGKDITLIIKGVAIIYMMLLHCYGRGLYLADVDFSHAPLAHVNDVFKICVGIFVFMVGYGYNFSKNKDTQYSLQHIKKLLIPFWVILFVFTVPVCLKSLKYYGTTALLFNLVGIDSRLNYYSWFVYFFIYAMIVMPFASRFIDRDPLRNSTIAILMAFVLEVGVHSIPGCLENKVLLAIFNCMLCTPGMVLGYYFAHERLFERFPIPSRPVGGCVGIALVVLPLVARWLCGSVYGFSLDFFYVPLEIAGIVLLFNVFRLRYLRTVLQTLGGVSVYMWFFHALFFTRPVSWFYQPAITIFHDINLVVLWAIVLTFCASWLISHVVEIVMASAGKFIRKT